MSLFVSLEGVEGSGKSTLRTKLAELFPLEEREIVVTREPGATPLGQQIRSLLLDRDIRSIDSVAELLLFNADRAQHLAEIVRPALARNALVICDRYIHSTLAYQGYGRGIALDALHRLNTITTGGLMPDLVFLLDIDPKIGLARAKERSVRSSGAFNPAQMNASAEWNRFEDEEIAFHTRVRDGFLSLAKESSGLFVILDAREKPEIIADKAAAELKRRL